MFKTRPHSQCTRNQDFNKIVQLPRWHIKQIVVFSDTTLY